MFKTSFLAILVMVGAVFAPNFLASNAAGQPGGHGPCNVDREVTVCPDSAAPLPLECSRNNSTAGGGVFDAHLNTNQAGVINCSTYWDTNPILTFRKPCGARIGIKVTTVCGEPINPN